MEELMMNMFSLIADQVRNKKDLFEEEGKIMQTLLNGGYRLHEADAAITLMQSLVQKQDETFFAPEQSGYPAGIRTMNSEERRRFSPEAFAFALKITHLGILSEDQREELLERGMALTKEQIRLEQVKGLLAFMLFTSSHEREEMSPARHGRIKNTAWN